jgi:LysM repeat protein
MPSLTRILPLIGWHFLCLQSARIDFMSAQNPFQIPDCFKLDIEQRRRERFKKTVVTAVAVSAAIVVGLLIEGCVSEKSQTRAGVNAAENTVQTPGEIVVSNPNPAPQAPEASQTLSQATLPVQSRPVALVPQTAAPVQATGGAVYFVKSGDTLSHIAKTHSISIKALKAANNLGTDRIVVGEQLKIPTA